MNEQYYAKRMQQRKLCGELQTNNLSTAYVEVTGIVSEDIYCFMENENLFP